MSLRLNWWQVGTLVLLTSGAALKPARGQDSTSAETSIQRVFMKDFMIGLDDAGSFFSTPIHFSGRDWLSTAGLVGVNLLLMTTDEGVKRWVEQDDRRRFDGGYQEVPLRYGKVEYANIFAIAMYSSGLLVKNDDIRITGRLLFESLSYSGALIIFGRYAAGRTRPFGADNAWEFKGFEREFRAQAFPSGHAAVSFTLSTVLAERIGNTWASIGLYSLAALNAFIQVYNNQHWFSDVVAGGAIGFGVSRYVVAREKERQASGLSGRSRLRIIPGIDGVTFLYGIY